MCFLAFFFLRVKSLYKKNCPNNLIYYTTIKIFRLFLYSMKINLLKHVLGHKM